MLKGSSVVVIDVDRHGVGRDNRSRWPPTLHNEEGCARTSPVRGSRKSGQVVSRLTGVLAPLDRGVAERYIICGMSSSEAGLYDTPVTQRGGGLYLSSSAPL
jgi:hypothetical protein